MAKEVRIVIPDSVAKKLLEMYEEEGYNSVYDFIADIIRDRVMIKDGRKKKYGKKKKTFLDYFSRKRSDLNE